MRASTLIRTALVVALAGCEKATPNAKPQPQNNPKSSAQEWHVATSAFDMDCSHAGLNPDGSVQFVLGCPASSNSPDGQWKLAVGDESASGEAPVTIENAKGAVVGRVKQLEDGMPFTVLWSPRPNWFVVNHHVGSFMDRPEVYEIAGNQVIRHGGITIEARKQAMRISPCLRAVSWDFVHGDAVGWSDDGKRLAWYFVTRTDACMGPHESGPVPADQRWKMFWMISDAETGAVVPGSVRIVPDNQRAEFPGDKLYAEYRPAGL